MSRSIYLFPKERMGVTYPFVFWDGLFSDEELDRVKEYCRSLELVKGTTVGKDGVMDENNDARKSDIAWAHPDDTSGWIFERLVWVTEKINDRFYEMDLNGFSSFQYTVYNGKKKHKYDYHMDTILGSDKPVDMPETRKLSMSLILSDPADYEGGEFYIQSGSPEQEKLLKMEQLKGRILAFPSFMIHGVAPVTKGIRESIVVWVEGPKFK